MEENVFYIEEQSRPPGHGNNCNGHNRSIQAGGNGHWVGDSCGCDGSPNSPSVSIDTWIYPLFAIAVLIILAFKLKRNNN